MAFGIKESVKAMIQRIPWGREWLRRRRSRLNRRRFGNFGWTKLENTESVFNHHYSKRAWRNTESVSGTGSTIAYTEPLRQALPQLVDRLKVKKLLDAPCGDFNWMREVSWIQPVSYIGGDIVSDIVEAAQKNYGMENRSFIKLDLTCDPLPDADLWMCRDCLFHLSEDHIFDAMANFARSTIPWVLVSVHEEVEENLDIPDGAFRKLDLRLAPFHLPEPEEKVVDWVEGHYPRFLGLWHRDVIVSALSSSRPFARATRRLS